MNKRYMESRIIVFGMLALIFAGCFTGLSDENITGINKKRLMEAGPVIDELGLGNPLRLYDLQLHPVRGISGDGTYGPYFIDGKEYKILDGHIEPKSNPDMEKKIGALHEFHLSVRMQPLFYGPLDKPSQGDFSKYRDFGKEQYLARECNVSMPYPKEYLSNLSLNILRTEEFLSQMSLDNAEKLLEQNRATLKSYEEGLNQYIKAFTDPDIEDSSCYSRADAKSFSFVIPFANLSIKNKNIRSVFLQLNENARLLEERLENKARILDGQLNHTWKPLDKVHKDRDRIMSYPNRTLAVRLFNIKQVREQIGIHYIESNYTPPEPSNRTPGPIPMEPVQDDYISNINVSDIKITEPDENELYLFEIGLECFDFNETLVYGFDGGYDPNVFIATHMESCLDDMLYVCTCPYSLGDMLRWYSILDMFNKVGNEPLAQYLPVGSKGSVDEAEQEFLDYPSEQNLKYLAFTYKKTYHDLLNSGIYNAALEELWIREKQISSPIHLYKKTFDGFYDNLDMRYQYFWRPDYRKDKMLDTVAFQRELLTESQFYFHMMPWASTIYFSGPLDDLTDQSSEPLISELTYWEDFFTGSKKDQCYLDILDVYNQTT